MSVYGMSRLVARQSRRQRYTPRKFSVHYLRITDAFSMADQSENRTEDLEPASSQVSVASKDEKVSISTIVASSEPDREESTKPKLASSTSTANGKRQRTLFDMLGSAPSQGSNAPSKKPKLTASASGSSGNDKVSAAVSSSGGSSGLKTLNSIPFSSSEYIDSLTGDQKRLLNLECETMGKSW